MLIYDAARHQAANIELKAVLDEAARLAGRADGLGSQLDDYALAWVEAV